MAESWDNKTGNPPLLEGLLSQTSSPLEFPLPWDSGWRLGFLWVPAASTQCGHGSVPVPFPPWGLGLEGRVLFVGMFQPSQLPGGWCCWALGVVALSLDRRMVAFTFQRQHGCSSFGRAPAPLLFLQSSSSSCLVPSPSQEGEVGQNLHSLPRFSA